MDEMQVKELEEKFREAASTGDEDTVKILVEKGVNVNSQNQMNGWSALHWAAKRGHEKITTFLLDQGADCLQTTTKGETALQLAKTHEVQKLLGGDANGDAAVCMKDDLPITPNYISNPPFPYMTQSQFKSISDSPVNLSMVGTNQRQTPSPQHASHQALQNHTPLPLLVEGKEDENELVLKVRVANSAETDFIEIELDKDNLMFEALISIMCQELEVNRKLVQKIRKLPDTIVRKDKDVRRLHDFQELELVLTNKAISESSRNYTNSQPGPQPRPVDVVY